MHIRKANRGDRAQIARLLAEVLPDSQPHNEPNRVLDQKWQVDDLLFVAEEVDGIQGCVIAGYDGHRGWLYSLAVAPGARRRGTGSRLVATALAVLAQRGALKVNLQVRADNREVVQFYRKLGFAVEERISMGRLIGNS